MCFFESWNCFISLHFCFHSFSHFPDVISVFLSAIFHSTNSTWKLSLSLFFYNAYLIFKQTINAQQHQQQQHHQQQEQANWNNCHNCSTDQHKRNELDEATSKWNKTRRSENEKVFLHSIYHRVFHKNERIFVLLWEEVSEDEKS